jgi:hypothetical protein
MDARLSLSHLALELNRTDVANGRVASGRVVEPLDVVEQICSGLVPGAIPDELVARFGRVNYKRDSISLHESES